MEIQSMLKKTSFDTHQLQLRCSEEAPEDKSRDQIQAQDPATSEKVRQWIPNVIANKIVQEQKVLLW